MTFFVTRKSGLPRAESDQLQKSFIDILYDHRKFLDDHGGFLGPESLARLCGDKKIAIIGAGPAGLASAWLLMKMGLKPDIYEAEEARVGGRIWTHHCTDAPHALFEMGAMRVPPSEQVFKYFADLYRMPSGPFPDPGIVDTRLQYQGKTYDWDEGGDVPAIFQGVKEDWEALVTEKMEPIANCLKDGDFDQAQTQWQALLTGKDTGWSNLSFYGALKQQFPHWTAREFDLFGTLGIGSGGFGPLYAVNFAEIARLVINGLEDSQEFYPEGMDKLVDGLYSTQTPIHGTTPHSLETWSQIRFNQPVKSVTSKSDGGVEVKSIDPCGHTCTEDYDAVIVATTTRSMEIDLRLTNPVETSPLNNDEITAVQNLHLMNSSKLFLRTRTKFWTTKEWKASNLPENIQTDGLCRGVYCLDYPGTDSGVVLLSYTWGDDSTKLIALDVEKRKEILLNSLESACPEFVEKLREEICDSKNVDWQLEPNYFGAFKLNQPGQDLENQHLYSQFLSVKNPTTDKGVYLAGDSVSWSGGWIEGALQTAMNASAAVIARLAGEQALHPNNPLEQTSDLFDYGT
ncbi:tryptophan 2-monooxygenase [Kistimonas scapharcae]|uniref:Tryptophan 2-monooxygenase n=1 Tax=Kistimonas scapharcae TaxID=1036133 RepID=A0ABP8V7D5_9GAMM